MSDKHEVTVYDRVPATATVSFGQLEHYLYRNGWNPKDSLVFTGYGPGLLEPMTAWLREGDRHEDPIHTSARMPAAHIVGAIERVAERLGVQPSAVLADIAAEPI